MKKYLTVTNGLLAIIATALLFLAFKLSNQPQATSEVVQISPTPETPAPTSDFGYVEIPDVSDVPEEYLPDDDWKNIVCQVQKHNDKFILACAITRFTFYYEEKKYSLELIDGEAWVIHELIHEQRGEIAHYVENPNEMKRIGFELMGPQIFGTELPFWNGYFFEE